MGVTSGAIVCEPHLGICCDQVGTEGEALDTTAGVSEETRETSLDLMKDDPDHLMRYFRSDRNQTTLFDFDGLPPSPLHATPSAPSLTMPAHHPVLDCDLGKQDPNSGASHLLYFCPLHLYPKIKGNRASNLATLPFDSFSSFNLYPRS